LYFQCGSSLRWLSFSAFSTRWGSGSLVALLAAARAGRPSAVLSIPRNNAFLRFLQRRADATRPFRRASAASAVREELILIATISAALIGLDLFLSMKSPGWTPRCPRAPAPARSTT
jgi:hypothetical protein